MISLDTVKEHLQIVGVDSEDKYLCRLLNRAVAIIERDINCNQRELDEREQSIFEQAVLLLVGDYYKNREDTTDLSVNTMPNGVRMLCNMIRRYNR